MREMFRYAMLTVGFRYGSYAAAFSLLAALLLNFFLYDPFGQFRLLIASVTIVILILAIREYKYIYNQGKLTITDGFIASLAIGIVSSIFYGLVVLIWIYLSEKTWDLHVTEMIRIHVIEKEGFVNYYSEEAYQEQLKKIVQSGLENREDAKIHFALFTLWQRLLWSLFIGFMVSVYYRN